MQIAKVITLFQIETLLMPEEYRDAQPFPFLWSFDGTGYCSA
jgi:hypothetical protein